MRCTQISIFLENKAGRLAQILSLFAQDGLNIRAISLSDTSDFGILRVIADKPDKAADLFWKHGFTVGKTDVVAVEFPDKPGELAKLAQIFASQEINVEYMYPCARHHPDFAIMIFRFDRTDEALALLENAKYSLPEVTE